MLAITVKNAQSAQVRFRREVSSPNFQGVTHLGSQPGGLFDRPGVFFGQVVCVLEDGLALRRSNDHRPQADLAGRLSSLNPWVGNYYFAAMEWSMQ